MDEYGFPLVVLTVLVVDDRSMARRIASRILSEEGFRVLEADGMGEALEVLAQARGRIDLVMLPNQEHGYGSASNYMTRRRWDYFVRYLKGAEPPREYRLK